jgi:hypothetical protein
MLNVDLHAVAAGLYNIESNYMSSTSLPPPSTMGVEPSESMDTKLANVMASLQLLLQQQAQMTRVMEDEHARDKADMTQERFENTHPVGRILLGRITYLTTYFVFRNKQYRWEPGAKLSDGDLQLVHNHAREAVQRVLTCHSRQISLEPDDGMFF